MSSIFRDWRRCVPSCYIHSIIPYGVEEYRDTPRLSQLRGTVLQMLQEHSRLCFWYRISDGASPLHVAAGEPDPCLAHQCKPDCT